MNYWQVDVKLTIEHESGKIQKVTEKYLVQAVSPTDAEAKVYKDFEGESNFTVDKIVKTKIIKISAQCYLNKFYTNLQFKPIGEKYLEDGIPHVAMLRE